MATLMCGVCKNKQESPPFWEGEAVECSDCGKDLDGFNWIFVDNMEDKEQTK